MNDKEPVGDTRSAVLAALRSRGPAMFVSDLSSLVPGQTAELETLLARLESKGAVLVRDHYCPDPHLEGEDLRVVGLIDASGGGDGVARCVESLEATWSAWLASYLAEHRCS